MQNILIKIYNYKKKKFDHMKNIYVLGYINNLENGKKFIKDFRNV